jgi:hypothetical protein
MNRIKIVFALTLIAALGLVGCAEQKIAPSLDQPMTCAVSQWLQVYHALTGKEVAASNEVWNDPTMVIIKQTKPVTHSEAGKMIEKALREQAGIIVVHENSKRVEFALKKKN